MTLLLPERVLSGPVTERTCNRRKLTAILRQQGRSVLTLVARLATLHQVAQEATPLLSAGFPNTQDSLHEAAAPATIRTAAALPPHGMSQRSLGSIVRRLDTFVPAPIPARKVARIACRARC